ncbi:MAG: tetratricopeptide repeat protein [Myxococcota bacterium]
MSGLAPLLLGLSLAQSPVHPSVDAVSGVMQSLRDWRFDEARTRASNIFEKRPDDPLSFAALADAKLFHGDYEGAVDLYRRAREAGVPEVLLRNESLAAAAAAATQGYEETVGEHFVIRHVPGRDAILVPFAMQTLNRALAAHARYLGFTPEGRVVVEFYPSAKTLAKVSSLTEADIENSGTIALCKWNRLMVTTPRAVAFGYAWRDTVSHELAHLIIGGASRNNAPIWLQEGLAKFLETAWRGTPGQGISVAQQEALRRAAEAGELIPFEKMHPSMAKLPTQEQTSLAFSEVFTFIEFLVERRGWAGIRSVLDALAEGLTDVQAIERVHGLPFSSLERQWQARLPKRPILRPSDGRPVKGAQPIELKRSAETPDDELAGLDEEARRFARAADLLYARGRIDAAKKELQKAQLRSPSPQLAGKLAFVALQAGDLEAAEAAARTASLDARSAGPHVILAQVLIQQGKLKEAELPLERAIDVNPFDPRIHEALLVVEEKQDSPRARAAQAAVALMSAPSRPPSRSLGVGAKIRVEGPPFHRVSLARLDEAGRQEEWTSTLALTPTRDIDLSPGRYRLRLHPPSGPPTTRDIRVQPGSEVQPIVTEPTGS